MNKKTSWAVSLFL